MARRRVPDRSARGRGRGGDRAESYYAATDSDRSYASKARRRMRRSELRAWAIRLVVLAGLGLLAWAYGPDLWNVVRARAGTTAEEFEGVGAHIRGGAARRGGAELEETTP